MAAEHPDRPIFALELGQQLVEEFKASLEPSVAKVAMELVRDASNLGGQTQYVVDHERARAGYEIGRRLEDPVLLQEADTFYRRALELAPTRQDRRRIRSQLREAVDIRGGLIAMAALRESGGRLPAVATFDLAIESVPVTEEVVRKPQRRDGAFAAHYPLASLRVPASVELLQTPATRPQFGPPERSSRGRPLSGWIAGYGMADGPQVDRMALTVVVPNDPDVAEEMLRAAAKSIFEWSERVSRWLDVLSHKPPHDGSWFVANFLYGSMTAGGTERELTLSADGAGMVAHGYTDPRVHRLDKFEIAYVLNRLAIFPVPVAIEFLRFAEHTQLMHQPREALVAAGTAAESALSLIYDAADLAVPREPKWSLGTLVSKMAQVQGALPPGETQASVERTLVRPRNDAVHRGVADREVTENAIELCARIVDQVFRHSSGDPIQIERQLLKYTRFLDQRTARTAAEGVEGA